MCNFPVACENFLEINLINLIEHGDRLILVDVFGGRPSSIFTQVSGSIIEHCRSNGVSAWRPSIIHMQCICPNIQWAEVSMCVRKLIIMHLEIYSFKAKHHPYYICTANMPLPLSSWRRSICECGEPTHIPHYLSHSLPPIT